MQIFMYVYQIKGQFQNYFEFSEFTIFRHVLMKTYSFCLIL